MRHEKSPTAVRRCAARTRCGNPCQSPPVRGRRRCRMHGGAAGSGAPIGNKNALRHGHYTAEAIAERRAVAALIRLSRATLADLTQQEWEFFGVHGVVPSLFRLAPPPGAAAPAFGNCHANRRLPIS
jgi:hypothetical protein